MGDEYLSPRASVSARAQDVADYDAGELAAGPRWFRGSVRVDDPRWGPTNAVTLTDIALTEIAAIYAAPGNAASLDLLFTDDDALARLNAQFRGKAQPTNVLSFPSGEDAEEDGTLFLGSIALAFDTCHAEAVNSGIIFAHHATHLIVHGVLHLLGFDHEDDASAEVMERLEVEILARVGIADPYEGK